MPIAIETQFAFELPSPTDALLQFEAARIPEQTILETDTQVTPSEHVARVPAQENIGERLLVRAEGALEVSYSARVDIARAVSDLARHGAIPPHEIPGEAVEYLFDSRYCPADDFQSFAEAEFGGTSGGARIAAISDWIADHFSYVPGSSTTETGAVDSFVARQGICRDYAHVLIALARASAIPARYVACYAPGVDPPDFHAVAEVFLADPAKSAGGVWQLVDATRMACPSETVKIGVGRDAADVSFLTTFGPSTFRSSCVRVTKE
ncbi:transglutaminase-like domain-containing protein [Qipengyuania flava]|uniref:transglutaminase-like domain-containing protein n=1 Tax=Qipengyuania flava TaxID=192812 RepID=UPI001C628DC8|nr:transglutaminase family protein [Qipengyuania flava]QYJ07893.1 transglutaminase family protein [Qipengyuania flava]